MLDVQPHQARQLPAVMLVHFPVLEEHDFATIRWLHVMIEGMDDGNVEMLRDSSDRMYKVKALILSFRIALGRSFLLNHSPS